MILTPPILTAYFCAARRPGIVLRVSNIIVWVSFIKSTKWAVRVAVADKVCKKLRAVRSAVNMLLAEPVSVQNV